MPRRIKLICPKDPNKHYFSFKNQTYQNDLSVYVNNALLFSHINDAEEYLPIELSQDFNIDESKEYNIRFEYNISFGPEKEKVDVSFKFRTDNICETVIHRYNHVEGSENLDDEYLVTFDICGQKTFLDKSYHTGNSKDIKFNSFYTYPLSVRWTSRKPFTTTKKVYWDDIEFRIE